MGRPMAVGALHAFNSFFKPFIKLPSVLFAAGLLKTDRTLLRLIFSLNLVILLV